MAYLQRARPAQRAVVEVPEVKKFRVIIDGTVHGHTKGEVFERPVDGALQALVTAGVIEPVEEDRPSKAVIQEENEHG